MENQNPDEIDLGFIFQKINAIYRGLMATLYKIIRFFFKHWIPLVIIIVVGAVAGHFWTKSIKYEKDATLIITNNFNSTNYVYDAITLLLRKQKQGDGEFLAKYGFSLRQPEISDLVIEPIINLYDLLEKPETSDRNLEQFFDQSDFQEDILLSEIFIPEYKYHRLHIITTPEGTDETVDKILAYLNSNEIYQATREATVADILDQIEQNKHSIESIDAVFDVFGGKVTNDPNPSQIYFRHQENNNLHQLMTSKNELLLMNEDLNKKLIMYQDVVQVINRPKLKYLYGPFVDKRTLLPLSLVALFIMSFLVRDFYRYIKRIYEAGR